MQFQQIWVIFSERMAGFLIIMHIYYDPSMKLSILWNEQNNYLFHDADKNLLTILWKGQKKNCTKFFIVEMKKKFFETK